MIERDLRLVIEIDENDHEPAAVIAAVNGQRGTLEVAGFSFACQVSVMRVLPVSQTFDHVATARLFSTEPVKWSATLGHTLGMVPCPACWPHDGEGCACQHCQQTGLVSRPVAIEWIKAHPSGYNANTWPAEVSICEVCGSHQDVEEIEVDPDAVPFIVWEFRCPEHRERP